MGCFHGLIGKYLMKDMAPRKARFTFLVDTIVIVNFLFECGLVELKVGDDENIRTIKLAELDEALDCGSNWNIRSRLDWWGNHCKAKSDM
jgi:hypothetical protein